MRYAAVELFVLHDRRGDIVHATVDPDEAMAWAAEDCAIAIAQRRVVLRVDDERVEIA